MTSLRRARAAANLLHRPPGQTPESIVRRLLAVQSQDIIQGRRALRARGEGLTAAGVNEAIVRERSIVVSWFNRGTLFMVVRDDYPWLLGLTTPAQFTASATRLGQQGISPAEADRAAASMDKELAEEGPLGRQVLRDRLAARGVPVEGPAFYHLLFHAAGRGRIVVGPLADGRQGVALTRDWLGIEPPAVPIEGERRELALAELARRYLAGHGPASDRDLAWWAGLPLRDARAGLGAIAGELAERGDGLVDLAAADRDEQPDRMPLRLLPMWDAYLLGWKEREFLMAARYREHVFNEGIIGPAVLLDGRAVGVWKAPTQGKRLAPEVEPFGGRIPKRELDAELKDLARFEGVELA